MELRQTVSVGLTNGHFYSKLVCSWNEVIGKQDTDRFKARDAAKVPFRGIFFCLGVNCAADQK
jgi:hypothetical protein